MNAQLRGHGVVVQIPSIFAVPSMLRSAEEPESSTTRPLRSRSFAQRVQGVVECDDVEATFRRWQPGASGQADVHVVVVCSVGLTRARGNPPARAASGATPSRRKSVWLCDGRDWRRLQLKGRPSLN